MLRRSPVLVLPATSVLVGGVIPNILDKLRSLKSGLPGLDVVLRYLDLFFTLTVTTGGTNNLAREEAERFLKQIVCRVNGWKDPAYDCSAKGLRANEKDVYGTPLFTDMTTVATSTTGGTAYVTRRIPFENIFREPFDACPNVEAIGELGIYPDTSQLRTGTSVTALTVRIMAGLAYRHKTVPPRQFSVFEAAFPNATDVQVRIRKSEKLHWLAVMNGDSTAVGALTYTTTANKLTAGGIDVVDRATLGECNAAYNPDVVSDAAHIELHQANCELSHLFWQPRRRAADRQFSKGLDNLGDEGGALMEFSAALGASPRHIGRYSWCGDAGTVRGDAYIAEGLHIDPSQVVPGKRQMATRERSDDSLAAAGVSRQIHKA